MMTGLNPQQQAAVTLPAQHALIVAGAGSGKTRVLTTRMAWLIQSGQVSPYELIAVTFTNKSAREMLVRLTAQLPLDTRAMWVGTFHGLCHRLLRAHHRDAGLIAGFQILDHADQQAAIKRLLKALGIDDEAYGPRDVQRFINASKEEGLRPDAVAATDARRERLVELYRQYQAQCEREGVVDFAELLLRAYELLQRNSPIREHYQRRFRHILVDEFQDTNRLQYQWLTLLAAGGACLFAVGDDDQSIYAFRGANVDNMAQFQRDYAKDCVIRLEQNYRSAGHILDAANALIAHNSARLGKNLWTERGQGEAIRVVELSSDQFEAAWVVEEIKAQRQEGIAAHEIAVLYRSNAQSRVLEHALFSAGVPYKVYGGLRFFERQEIKHALAYLRLLDNPHDDTAWLRVANFPTRGIGARTLEQLSDSAREYNCSLYAALPYTSGRGAARLNEFAQLVAQMAKQAEALTLPELVDDMLDRSGLRAYYQTQREGEDRLENLNELVSAATAFVIEEHWSDWPAAQRDDTQLTAAASSEVVDGLVVEQRAQLSPLAAFLAHASLEAGDNQAQDGHNAVQLMTVHAAKGLEFDSVFITGIEEGLFPHENSLIDVNGLEEERRLMYVAMTRARTRLYMTLAQSRMLHGQTRYGVRSRFLDEIPDEHLKWISPQQGAASGHHSAPWQGAFRRGGRAFQDAHHSAQPMAARYSSSVVTVQGQDFRIGQGVRHARFGEGTVVSLSGAGQDAQAQVQFREAGLKTLALGIAKLEVIAG